MERAAEAPTTERIQEQIMADATPAGGTVKMEKVGAVAKVLEITAQSKKSFKAAIRKGVERANQTVKGIEGAWIKEQKVRVKDSKIVGFRVDMKVTFVLEE